MPNPLGNIRNYWESYLLGLDPTDSNDVWRVMIDVTNAHFFKMQVELQ